MLNRSHLAAPWGLYPHDGSFEIRNAVGDTITYIYFAPDGGQKTGRQSLCKTDAQEVALAFLRLPEFMGWKG